MGTVDVDQIVQSGGLVRDVDVTLTDALKTGLLLKSLPGSRPGTIAGVRVLEYHDHVIFKKQVTHLGYPWPEFKKRIQIPHRWLDAANDAIARGLTVHFVGIYHYKSVTIFVDFEPGSYLRRKANNSAAHVSTNDLYQAQTLGEFSRQDGNGNRLTSVRADLFEDYLLRGVRIERPHVDVLRSFNETFLQGMRIYSMDAIREMHAAGWPDAFQGEWPGFYLEHRLNDFMIRDGLKDRVRHQKVKQKGGYDYDLAFLEDGRVSFYGDLKASTVERSEAPGNDAERLRRCVDELGRFWYVIYEHETWRSKDLGNRATIEWNEWKRDLGRGPRPFNRLSYGGRFKDSVRFVSMKVLEINAANFGVVLKDFAQGRQPDGAKRALKVMIKKGNLDNFLVYSESVRPSM